MTEKFNLTEKIVGGREGEIGQHTSGILAVEDVAEFIRLLKEETLTEIFNEWEIDENVIEWVFREIDNLSGTAFSTQSPQIAYKKSKIGSNGLKPTDVTEDIQNNPQQKGFFLSDEQFQKEVDYSYARNKSEKKGEKDG